MNQILRRTKANAHERGYVYTLSKEQLLGLMSQHCHYCGAEPSNVSSGRDYNGSFTYNGVDRVDNDQGYMIDNVVSCCRQCNVAKHTHPAKAFLEWVTRVYEHSVVSHQGGYDN